MPTTELLGDERDSGRLFAVMLYPNDLAGQDRYLGVNLARREVQLAEADGMRGRSEIHVSLDLLRLLLDAPAYEAIRVDVAERRKRAYLAGALLAMLYVMVRLQIEEEPSLNKAIFALSQFAQEETFGDGSPIPRSERMIREALDEFRSVAHLWAALDLNQSYPYAPVREETIPPHQEKFLRVAAGILDSGCEFVPLRARPAAPMIDRAGAWQIPEPYASQPLHLPREGVRAPDRLIKFLRYYRASRSL